MNRTIATKMIVMSNEFRTRGSIPGATRSEIITRSSACEAMRITPFANVTTVTIRLHAGAAQDPRQHLGPDRERIHVHVLVRGVRTAPPRADILRCPARHAPDVDRDPARRVVEPVQPERQPRQRLERADTVLRLRRMRRASAHAHRESAGPLARRLQPPRRRRW